MKDVLNLSMTFIKIWLYPERPSMNEYMAARAALSTRTSMCGRGKSSLGVALLRSRKSTQVRTLPSFLATGTTLDNHSGYSTTSRNLALICLAKSSLTFSAHSALIHRSFYLTCLLFGLVGI